MQRDEGGEHVGQFSEVAWHRDAKPPARARLANSESAFDGFNLGGDLLCVFEQLLAELRVSVQAARGAQHQTGMCLFQRCMHSSVFLLHLQPRRPVEIGRFK